MKTQPANSVDATFRALADWTRLRILNLLRGGELCVCDLVDVLEIPQPSASRHLAQLRKARLVVARKEGLWSYYRLARAHDGLHEKLLEALAAAARQAPELAHDARRLATRGKGCCE
jgi:ArsR family transcriptional regulator, arsenate/arsenite/antimonite-responsive transcriptional repressor